MMVLPVIFNRKVIGGQKEVYAHSLTDAGTMQPGPGLFHDDIIAANIKLMAQPELSRAFRLSFDTAVIGTEMLSAAFCSV